jgi:galactosylceramidase
MKGINFIKIAFLFFCSFTVANAQTIVINGSGTGRTFEGIGALSAGASSRLLIDYPEPYRSDILDYLFKPNFGANLYELKVENGGDVNSTDGSELSYAHTREEFLHPKKEYFNRGYEWWLIKEAQKRNPAIRIEILQWGAPGWVGNGKFYSKENADFIAGYIKGLKKYHNINIDYTGIRNEVMYDINWIKLLRKTLDANGLSKVKIDVGDQWKPADQWQIAKDIAKDSELSKAVYAINAHVPEETDFVTPAETQQIQKPIWSGESHQAGGDWSAAKKVAKTNNHSYPLAKITKVISWSLITSYPDFLTAPNSGFMKANTPWSGHYTVQPPLWMVAHINQFARPGWKFIDEGCQYFKEEGLSVISLKNPSNGDYSVIIETMDATKTQTVHFKIKGNLSGKDLEVWRSTFDQTLFEKQKNIHPQQKEFSITLQPNSIYSLTTTRGQHKGKAATHNIPADAPFPHRFKDNFDKDSLNREPPFFINYHGAFEVVKDKNSSNQFLQQASLQQGINWFKQPYPRILFGDSSWTNIETSVDFLLPDTGVIRLETRLNHFSWNSHIDGYSFEINEAGDWKIKFTSKDTVLQKGNYDLAKRKWHHLQFNCKGDELSVLIDHNEIANVHDATFKSGVVALATGWNKAYFDNFEVKAE